MAKLAVIYYSSTGTIHSMAKRLAEAGEKVGAEVRLRQVPELAPQEAIASNADIRHRGYGCSGARWRPGRRRA
ncbi:flavodoxin domain-containing protein, partial [Micromonospora musae]|uniref:flavodoxin domain-containing protein n=1 Tax=Micromonospora musae TaxID=1894970 RepID=UPI003406AF3B